MHLQQQDVLLKRKQLLQRPTRSGGGRLQRIPRLVVHRWRKHEPGDDQRDCKCHPEDSDPLVQR